MVWGRNKHGKYKSNIKFYHNQNIYTYMTHDMM